MIGMQNSSNQSRFLTGCARKRGCDGQPGLALCSSSAAEKAHLDGKVIALWA